jgi:HlyD family secretion protein
MQDAGAPELKEMADDVRAVIRSEHKRGQFGLAAWGLAGIAAVGILAWWLWPAGDSIRWEAQDIDRGDMVLTATATGNLRPKSEVIVGAEISGLVKEVWVAENDVVEQGALLARFDSDELEVNLEQAEARLALARASVEEAEATLEEAVADERRKSDLVARNLTSQAEHEIARAAAKRAVARLSHSKASVREASGAVSAARTRLAKATIRSPINGVVLSRNVEPGNTVAATFQAPELFLLAEDLRQMELHVSLDEADVGMVRAGQAASFTVDAWPGSQFPAEVLSVHLYPSVEANVVTYTTVLGVDNSDGRLLPGMTATATIHTGTREQVLRVPNLALRFRPPSDDAGSGLLFGPPAMMGRDQLGGAGNVIWVLRNGQPERVPVRTGYTDGRYTEVESDKLRAGDRVVVGMTRAGG